MSSTLVEELWGENPELKAMIHRRKDGLLQITVWKWTHEVVPGQCSLMDSGRESNSTKNNHSGILDPP